MCPGLQLRGRNIYAVQAVYSSFLEGFAVVLSDGRAALIALSKPESKIRTTDHDSPYEESIAWNAKGIWAPGLTQATCVAINHKYRLIGFGTKK